jgi:hypothetical protein
MASFVRTTPPPRPGASRAVTRQGRSPNALWSEAAVLLGLKEALPRRQSPFSTADRASHHWSEQFPARAVEAHHLHLFDRGKVVRALLIVMPGSSIPSSKFLRLAACFMTFSRVRLSPLCLSTATKVSREN